MVGDSPTPDPESEGTYRPRWAQHGRETTDFKERLDCTAPGPGSDFLLKYGRWMADSEEG